MRTSDSPEGERLQKVLARAGLGSRRSIEELIAAGRIAINGRVARLGDRVDPDKDEVEVDGSKVPLKAELVYLLMNKPEGVVTTASDPEGRTTVLELLETDARVYPVGRLDLATEGALLLTNDGELAHRLAHPRYKVPKRYLADVKGTVSRPTVRRILGGLELEDGFVKPRMVNVVQSVPGGSLVEIEISEGRNREVRRIFEEVGHPVRRLVRTHVGPLMLGRLKPGSFRRLSIEEVRALYRACGL